MPMLLQVDATGAALQEGLSDREAADRLARDGPNELPAARPRSTAAIAADVLRDPMLLLLDPVRPGVPDAIRECHGAGILVVMLTSDYPATARSIARQIGLRNDDGCLSGPELVGMDDATIRRTIRSVDVFARIKPDQKLRLVRALQANGEVVAMTGDGVNDAPALKAADIGVAMGSRGTEVAREAAALVLLDDDFTSIVRAVRLGRRIYDNIRKAVGYVLAIHVPSAGITLVPSPFGWPLVLMPQHVIFMETIIDPACSVAFEMEPEEGDVMRRRPRDPRMRLFSPRLVLRSLLQGSGMLMIALAVYIGSRQAGLDDRDVRTPTFTTLIISNLMLILTNRSLARSLVFDRRSVNPALGWIVGTAVVALGVVLFVPAARDLFVLGRPRALDLAVCAAAGLMAITWMELLKFLTRDQVLDGALPP
jgi:Ca2+-transporting ATPase